LDTSGDVRKQIISLDRDFVKNEVTPVASKLDNDDEYPHELVDIMKELGLFGITIPGKYGGLGLDHTTFATIFEELSKGWMSLTGMIGTHHILANIIGSHGSDEQKQRFLPKMVTGEIRGGLALTEPGAGSDVQNITASAIIF
jgi:butyryl-CoA dehydrogenase